MPKYFTKWKVSFFSLISGGIKANKLAEIHLIAAKYGTIPNIGVGVLCVQFEHSQHIIIEATIIYPITTNVSLI